jgi:hypothetical protein
MFKATRSMPAISFRKRLPNTRPKLWSASSPLTNAGGGTNDLLQPTSQKRPAAESGR